MKFLLRRLPFFSLAALVLVPTASTLFAEGVGSCVDQLIDDSNSESKLRLLRIRPSECDPTGRVGPNITVANSIMGNDEFHFVIGRPCSASALLDDASCASAISGDVEDGCRDTHAHVRNINNNSSNLRNSLIVHLPGTTDHPSLSSCLLRSVAASGNPTIGLTYAYLRRGDTARNDLCGTLPTVEDTVECLAQQHEDALFGGRYGASATTGPTGGADVEAFWQEIDARDSISGRLGMLLRHLDEEYPDEGWGDYYYYSSSKSATNFPNTIPNPIFERITFIGHSQGAGHAAYLARMRAVRGAALLSGPQDECVGCATDTTFWVDGPFNSTAITALAHADDGDEYEPTLPIIRSNWARFGTFPSTDPVDIGTASYDVCRSPIVTSLRPASTSSCGRRGHCSTALDDSTPFLETTFGEAIKVYGIDLWRSLAVDLVKCHRPCGHKGLGQTLTDTATLTPPPSTSSANEKSLFCFALLTLFAASTIW